MKFIFIFGPYNEIRLRYCSSGESYENDFRFRFRFGNARVLRGQRVPFKDRCLMRMR